MLPGRWQNRRIVVTGSVPPFDTQFADEISKQPQIDEGDFLIAVVRQSNGRVADVRILCAHPS